MIGLGKWSDGVKSKENSNEENDEVMWEWIITQDNKAG